MSETRLTPHSGEAVTALIDARRLVQRCMQLEHEAEEQRERGAELERRLKQFEDEQQRIAEWAEAGRSEFERLRTETRARIRAAALAQGECERLSQAEAALDDESLSMQALQRLHRASFAELGAALPSRPCSRKAVECRQAESSDLAAFQFGSRPERPRR